ncbi:hypothetical protein Hypma_002907 [Hypsizygus marmoreus]|uniref:Uncharacterized protein n=1 Tax=Hypsizygus marmoreus TaxID=39966 RepID=A0A369J316_HYPMA|nr:hypothetical protein Hypma_002907 [Hypsizygus marmoreus]
MRIYRKRINKYDVKSDARPKDDCPAPVTGIRDDFDKALRAVVGLEGLFPRLWFTTRQADRRGFQRSRAKFTEATAMTYKPHKGCEMGTFIGESGTTPSRSFNEVTGKNATHDHRRREINALEEEALQGSNCKEAVTKIGRARGSES